MKSVITVAIHRLGSNELTNADQQASPCTLGASRWCLSQPGCDLNLGTEPCEDGRKGSVHLQGKMMKSSCFAWPIPFSKDYAIDDTIPTSSCSGFQELTHAVSPKFRAPHCRLSSDSTGLGNFGWGLGTRAAGGAGRDGRDGSGWGRGAFIFRFWARNPRWMA